MPRRNHPTVRAATRPGSVRPRARAIRPPKPRIGQHFLTDPMIARDIVDAADLSPSDDVLEVGPGKGALTEELLLRAGQVTAVELDEELATALRRRFAGEPRLAVVAANVLDHRPDELLGEAGRSGA